MSDPGELAIDGCLAGDERCWAALVRRCEKDVARQMWRFSRDPVVWEELIQDVFVELYYSLPRFQRRGGAFDHWLARIATRVGYRYWRRKPRDARPELLDQYLSAAPGPVEALEASDAARLLDVLLSQLPPPDRLVLTLTYFDDCTTRQIAERVGWTRATVKMRLTRARRKLKRIIEDCGLHEPERSGDGRHGMDRVARRAGSE